MHLAHDGLYWWKLETLEKNEQWKVLTRNQNASSHTRTRSLSHDGKRTHAFRFSFCFTFPSISLTRIKWSARAVASVNRDLDLVKESIRCCSNIHARASKHFYSYWLYRKYHRCSWHCCCCWYCYGCRLGSSLIFSTHTLFLFLKWISFVSFDSVIFRNIYASHIPCTWLIYRVIEWVLLCVRVSMLAVSEWVSAWMGVNTSAQRVNTIQVKEFHWKQFTIVVRSLVFISYVTVHFFLSSCNRFPLFGESKF